MSATDTTSPLGLVEWLSGISALAYLFTFVGFFIRSDKDFVDVLESTVLIDTFDDVSFIFFLSTVPLL